MSLVIAYQLLQAPEGRVDGSGQVRHDMDAVGREEGTEDPWMAIPNHHKDFLLTSDEVNDALDQEPDGAKVAAYKDYLEENVFTPADPLLAPPESDWSEQGLLDYTDAYIAWEAEFTVQNQASADAAERVNDFITGKGWNYPIQFRLSI